MTRVLKSRRLLRSMFPVVAVIATGCAGPAFDGAPAFGSAPDYYGAVYRADQARRERTGPSVAGGSAPDYYGAVYRAHEAQREQKVRFATIESIRQVNFETPESGVVAVARASALQQSLDRQPGLELTVRMDSGERRAIVQRADDSFHAGQHVRVLRDGDVARVTHEQDTSFDRE